jgi:MYXO-CTERM domain-containing protein
MFEFRDPSDILDIPLVPEAIPELNTSLLALVGFSLLVSRRRRAD